MIATCLLLLIWTSVTHAGYHPKDDCYHHFDHAAKYKLCHDTRGYPMGEINLVLERHPGMKDMFHEDDHPLTAPISHSKNPPQSVCPYDRHTLYSFFYANKDCYVIYPEVQKISYVQCSANNNYDCQRCGSYGGVSKCVEDYDYRHVWAYCLPHADLKPTPINLAIDPRPDLYYSNDIGQVDLKQSDYPKSRPDYPQRRQEYPQRRQEYPQRRPAYPESRPNFPKSRSDYPNSRPEAPQAKRDYQYARMYRDPWNKLYRPYVLQHRWKRSYHTAPAEGTIERLKLYLPHHCGCKNYVC